MFILAGDYYVGRGLHSFRLELNLSTFGTHSWVKLGYVGHKDSSGSAEM
jgi:hypothetical protein